ncbi:MAG: glycosyltransferase family 39 protein [bacterium]
MKSTLDKVYRICGRYRYEIYLIIISVFALAVHIHLASTLNLGNDEAHYYVWSLKPSFGYLDDAPLISWVIGFFTWILGKSHLSVRLGAVIFSFLDGFLIYYLSYLLFKNKRASFFAFLFFLSAVIFGMVLSVMILPDAPLLFFYLCFLVLFYKAVNSGPFSKKYLNGLLLWIFAGLFLGLAFLSKYTAALIPPSVLLYLAVSKKNRGILKTFYPYMALGIALLVFSPVIYWNWTHNFISFRFQLSHGFSHPKPGFPLFMAGWFGQFLVITPFIYIFLIAAFIYALKFILKMRTSLEYADWKKKGSDSFYSRSISPEYADGSEGINRSDPFFFFFFLYEGFLYSVCLSLPVLLFFVLNGYSHRILVHWPDIGYLPAFPVMGYVADLFAGAARKKGTDSFYSKSITSEYADGSKGINRSVPFFFFFLRRLLRRFVKYYVYFTIFSGFFLSFVLYNQIYYNSIPVGKIIKYIDNQKRLKKGGIFSLIPHIPGKPKTADITNDLFGWRHGAKYIGIVFNGYRTAYRPLFILTHHYAVADELVYYAGYNPAVNIYNISGFLNQYDLWQNLNKINGDNALFIMDNKYMLNPLKAYGKDFKSVKEIGRLDIYVKFRPVRVYYLYLMKDFNAKSAVRQLKAESRMY